MEREQVLLDYLNTWCVGKDNKRNLRTILSDLRLEYFNSNQVADEVCNSKAFNNALERRQLTSDIQSLVDNDNVLEVILSTPSGIYIANSNEDIQALINKEVSLAREWKRLHKQKKRLSKDGQLYYDEQLEIQTVEVLR